MADFRRFVLEVHFVVRKDHNGKHSNSRFFSNDQMVARLSTETNQKSAEIIENKPFFRKLRPPTEFVFRPYLSNGGA